jgi:glycosyltransferase involved in cell wall biosynthesis
MLKKSVLFLVPLPPHQAPSQRFRLEIYEPYLADAGITYKVEPFLDIATSQKLYKKGSALNKAWGILKGFLRRIKLVFFDVPRYDYVFVLRQASPVGPPFFEWIIAKLWRKKMIYDFDDALWVPRTSEVNMAAGWLKCSWKLKYIIKWSYKISAGNENLAAYARRFNSRVEIIPTCVDMERQHNDMKKHMPGKAVIGWTGSHSTIEFMKPVVPVIRKLQEDLDFTFLVICNKNPQLDLKDWSYIEWNEKTEVRDLLKMDIGLMPLADTPWTRGKCGFKIIQYLSLGIPAIASPVGVNGSILENGVNGFTCETDEDWIKAIKTLVADHELRQRMGEAGRKKIITGYSIQARYRQFLALFS